MDPAVPKNPDRETLLKKPGLLNDASFTPQITRKPSITKQPSSPGVPGPAPKLGAVKRDKFSSTATMFMDQDNFCLTPRVVDILHCVASAIHNHLLLSKSVDQVTPSVWSEALHPMGAKHDLSVIPSVEVVNEFLADIWNGQRLSAESAVMTIAYVDRFIALTEIQLQPANWRRILLAASILASKVWEDLAVWNADFLTIFPDLNVTDLNRLEREMLTALEFVVSLKASLYCKYYFDLRALIDDPARLPQKALSQEEINQLESKSGQKEEVFRQTNKGKKKSKSESSLLEREITSMVNKHKQNLGNF